MTAPLAPVVDLAAARARRAPPKPPPPPPTLTARAGCVLLRFGDGTGLELSVEHARAWAERLAAMADVAEAQLREGGPHAL